MGSLRTLVSYANEFALFLGALLCTGYFGTRYQLGHLPGILCLIIVLAGGGGVIYVASQLGGEDSQFNTIDRCIFIGVPFVFLAGFISYLGGRI